MDKRDLASGKLTAKDFELHSEFEVKDERKSAPKIYALFPVLPIVFALHFLQVCVQRIQSRVGYCHDDMYPVFILS